MVNKNAILIFRKHVRKMHILHTLQIYYSSRSTMTLVEAIIYLSQSPLFGLISLMIKSFHFTMRE